MAGIYLHIPFCKQKCVYCNFHFSTSLRLKDQMLDAIEQELILRKDFFGNKQVETIYFGGGTPSLLTADELNRLFHIMTQHFQLDHLKEITLEANPDDLSNRYVRALKSTPINRLSVGVQSFFDRDLQYMNRAHNRAEALAAIRSAQNAGYTNLTIDLIYGTPGMSDEDWLRNLQYVSDLAIPHFSAYALTVETGTHLHHMIQKKRTRPVEENQTARQFELLMTTAAETGFKHYEISNFAKNNQFAIHNTNYWRGIPYLGIGPSAHSFRDRIRTWNIANNNLYIRNLKNNENFSQEEYLSDADCLNEYIMTSLRTMWGCSLAKIASKWGQEPARQVSHAAMPFKTQGKVIQVDDTILLTRQGKLFADYIAASLFVENT